MVGQNSKKSNARETTFFISYDVMLEYICAKNIIHHNILKIANIFMNGLKSLSIFMKFHYEKSCPQKLD
jgi:hypothetical protein